jgi:hypothetical protein
MAWRVTSREPVLRESISEAFFLGNSRLKNPRYEKIRIISRIETGKKWTANSNKTIRG